MFKKWAISAITAFLAVLFLAGCQHRKYNYNGEHPDLYTVAIHSLLDSIGYIAGGEITCDSIVEVIEVDDYGRVLFLYGDGRYGAESYALMISQNRDDSYVYFYPDYNFIELNAGDWNRFDTTQPPIEEFFPADEVEALKTANDWNQERNYNKFAKAEITRNKPKGPVNKKILVEFYYYSLNRDDSGYDRSDTWYQPDTLNGSLFFIRYLTSDEYGRSIYYGYGRGTDRFVVLLFNPDGSYDTVKGVMEMDGNEIFNYREKLLDFKELNGWGNPIGEAPPRVSVGSYSLSSDYLFTLENNEITIIQYTGADANVNIPAEIDGFPVTNIGDKAFYYCTNLISVSIPDNVTAIGAKAFAGCVSLTDLALPDSITSIGESAFYRCESLTSLEIPDGVTSIGERAFQFCMGLTSVTIPGSVTEIGLRAFSDCTNLLSVVLPDSVTDIGDSLFYRCVRLTSAELSDNLTSIADQTFKYCRTLEGITIPRSVTAIGERSFADCKNLTGLVIPDGVLTISDEAFSRCANLNSLYIPDSVTKIGKNSFEFCERITSIRIPGSVKEIPQCAFEGSRNLTDLVIEDGVEIIGEFAFSGCDSLTTVTIPASVTHIFSNAFSHWSRDMDSIYFEGAAPYVEYRAFGGGNDNQVILYYKPGADGWTNPWNGYITETY